MPDFLPEGGTPISAVNNWGREVQAAVRRFYENIEWRDFGFTVSFNSNTAVNVEPGTTAFFAIGQRVQLATIVPVFQYATITGISGDVVLELDVDAGANVDAGVVSIAAGMKMTGGALFDVSAVDGAMAVVSPATSGNVAVQDAEGQLVNGPDILTTVTDGSSDLVDSDGIFNAVAAAIGVSSAVRATDGNMVFNTPVGKIMLQWGQESSSLGDETIAFNQAFSGQPYMAVATAQLDVASTGTATTNGRVRTLTQFNMRVDTGINQSQLINWAVIGPEL